MFDWKRRCTYVDSRLKLWVHKIVCPLMMVQCLSENENVILPKSCYSCVIVHHKIIFICKNFDILNRLKNGIGKVELNSLCWELRNLFIFTISNVRYPVITESPMFNVWSDQSRRIKRMLLKISVSSKYHSKWPSL